MQCRSLQTLVQTLKMQNNVTVSYGMSELSGAREKNRKPSRKSQFEWAFACYGYSTP